MSDAIYIILVSIAAVSCVANTFYLRSIRKTFNRQINVINQRINLVNQRIDMMRGNVDPYPHSNAPLPEGYSGAKETL